MEQELDCIQYIPDFINKEKSDKYFHELYENVKWEERVATIYGKQYKIPRLQQWYGTKSYTYSGMNLSPLPFIYPIDELKKLVDDACGVSFNSVLVNLYRDGNDTVGYHADNEPELGEQPLIASLSFGVERDFLLKKKSDRSIMTLKLKPGSLLVMFGDSQKDYLHSIPRRKNITNPRINLTFRNIL